MPDIAAAPEKMIEQNGRWVVSVADRLPGSDHPHGPPESRRATNVMGLWIRSEPKEEYRQPRWNLGSHAVVRTTSIELRYPIDE